MKNPNLFLFGSVILVLLAVALVAILDKTSPTSNSSDVRARAATQYTLKLLGTVDSVNEADGSIQVSGVQFSDVNRSGSAKDLGTWTVIAPAQFNFASVSPGSQVTIGVDAKTFQVTKHEVVALTL